MYASHRGRGMFGKAGFSAHLRTPAIAARNLLMTGDSNWMGLSAPSIIDGWSRYGCPCFGRVAATSKPAPNYFHPFELSPAGKPYTRPVKMATRRRRANVSLLDGRIDILNKDAVEPSPAKEVFRTVSTTLALVRVSAQFRTRPWALTDNPTRTG